MIEAALTLPSLPAGQIYLEGETPAEKANGVTLIEQSRKTIVYELSCGIYQFMVSE